MIINQILHIMHDFRISSSSSRHHSGQDVGLIFICCCWLRMQHEWDRQKSLVEAKERPSASHHIMRS